MNQRLARQRLEWAIEWLRKGGPESNAIDWLRDALWFLCKESK